MHLGECHPPGLVQRTLVDALQFLLLLDNGLDVDDGHGAEHLFGPQGHNGVQLAVPAGAIHVQVVNKGALHGRQAIRRMCQKKGKQRCSLKS